MMGIALTIVLGLTAMTLVAGYFDYLGKRSKNNANASSAKIDELEKRIRLLETTQIDKDQRLEQMERELSFVNRLLDDKTKK